jgi:hypothetical protein
MLEDKFLKTTNSNLCPPFFLQPKNSKGDIMPTKIENQIEVNKENELDVIFLTRLHKEIVQANLLLDQIFAKLGITATHMAKIQDSFDTRSLTNSRIWNLKEAQEFLDIIIATAALGKVQLIKNESWLVQVTAVF